MSRSFANVWKAAEGNVEGLPSCPKELCEPQYAALVFAKHCSMCGNQALRPMDPILLVRLCTECRDQQAVETSKVTDSTLVFASRTWCLYDQAKAIKDKLNALESEGNVEATEQWKKERRHIVQTRIKDAQPLITFLKKIENEHDYELSTVRKQREAEVKSRLIKLGWEQRDMSVWDREWRRQWKSAACIAKPLTERGWENILPTLVAYLERNRDRRLKQERERRQWERRRKISGWLDGVRDQQAPFALAEDIPAPEEPSSNEPSTSGSGSTGTEMKTWFMSGTKSPSARTLRVAFPYTGDILNWEAFKSLVETESSAEDLDQSLEASRPTLTSLVLNWIKDLENALVEVVTKKSASTQEESTLTGGDDTPTPTTSSTPEYTLRLGTGQPITNLASGVQQLLRADCIFMCRSTIRFYPDDFHGAQYERKSLTYHTQSVKVAKALLTQLSLPDATYLRLKAAGPVFTCGRCEVSKRMSWKDLIQHYVHEGTIYASVQKHPRVRSSSVTYVFVHDVDTAMPDKPLVRVISKEQAESDSKSNGYQGELYQQCLVCKSIGATYYYRENTTLDHIRTV
ncbi:hypothetical protein FRC07_004947, partial [Ceratobasidium sp. 392]